MPNKSFQSESDTMSSRQPGPHDDNVRQLGSEKEISTKESNVAKIKVVVCEIVDNVCASFLCKLYLIMIIFVVQNFKF